MIQVEHLTRRYGATVAIQDLGFEVGRGEIVGFLGPNGAGKSTTMRILAGALGATEGRALVGGIDVLEDPRAVKRIVGYLPEVPPLYTEMTVRDYLRFCARIKAAKDPNAAVERVMDRVGLREVAHRLVENLSKGYRQRVGLGQALVHDPQVLVLDEPTSGLDPGQRVEIRNLVRELAQGDVTVILSTHVLAEVEALCSRAIVIHRGRIVASDTMSALSGPATRLTLEVLRPDDALRTELLAVPGVVGVERDGARVVVQCDRDVREAVAAVAVRCGLVALLPHRGLEEKFLRLTHYDGEPGPGGAA